MILLFTNTRLHHFKSAHFLCYFYAQLHCSFRFQYKVSECVYLHLFFYILPFFKTQKSSQNLNLYLSITFKSETRNFQRTSEKVWISPNYPAFPQLIPQEIWGKELSLILFIFSRDTASVLYYCSLEASSLTWFSSSSPSQEPRYSLDLVSTNPLMQLSLHIR